MTNSQKAFEELVVVNIHKYDHPISANYTYENHLTDLRNAWQAAWDARGKFDEEVCEEGIHWYPGFKQEIHEITKQTCARLAEKIRKRGGE